MKSSILLSLVAVLTATFASAGPADDVKAAAKKLGDAPNYSWLPKQPAATGGAAVRNVQYQAIAPQREAVPGASDPASKPAGAWSRVNF